MNLEKVKLYDTLTMQEKWNILATISNLYYNSGMTQNEIADRMYTSRSKISRMLKEARELGIVEIRIKEPWEREYVLECRIKERYQVERVQVVVSRENNIMKQNIERLSEVTAYYLDTIIKENMVVGISWGNTLYHIVKYIDAHNKKNLPITVVPIMGASSINQPERDAMDLAKDLASAYGGQYQYICAPLYVRSEALRDSLVQDKSITKALSLAKDAEVILTSVGSIEHKTWESYLGENVFKSLSDRGAVGHIAGHFFDVEGNEVDTNLTKRCIGIDFLDLEKCRNVICVAYGTDKVAAIKGVLKKGKVVNTLIIDVACANILLN